MEAHFWLDWVRDFIGFFDMVIYSLINAIYVTFTNIANYSIISQDMIQKFATRIYALVGVFMLFKVSVSLINYFVDPDAFYDSSKGFGSIVKRIIISLIMLVSVSFVFEIAFKVQTIVLQENIIGNVILGGTLENKDIKAEDVYETAGSRMGFVTLQAFLHPEKANFISGEGLNDKETSVRKDWLEVVKDVNIVGLIDLKNKEDGSGNYIFRYSFGISTLAGLIVGFILLRFCFDVGVRSVKLSFLQLIAPMPIMSYVDPKSEMFNKWVKQCTSTYISLFIRLAAIFFVIYVISIMSTGDNGFLSIYEYKLTGDKLTQGQAENLDYLAAAFIIIGLLMFATEIPKLLEELFGLSMGGFSLNPLKNSPVAAAALGGLGGAVLGTAINGIASYKKRKELQGSDEYKAIKNGDGNFFSKAWDKHKLYKQNGATGNAVRGFFGGGWRSGRASIGGKVGAGITQGVTNTSIQRSLRGKGYGLMDKISDYASDISYMPKSTGTTSELENRYKRAKQKVADIRQQEENVDKIRQAFVQSETSRTGVSASELNIIGSYSIGADGEKRYGAYDNFAGWNEDEMNLILDGNPDDDVDYFKGAYGEYMENSKGRGVAEDKMLSENQFREQMSLNRAELRADKATKAAQKELGEAQKEMESVNKLREKSKN